MKRKLFFPYLLLVLWPVVDAFSAPPSAPPSRREFLRRFCLESVYDSPSILPAEKAYLDHNYDLWSSTSTAPGVKQWVEDRLILQQRLRESRHLLLRHAAPAPASSALPDAAFRLGEIYTFPNPAKGLNPTFHVETGLAERLEIRIYDADGREVHRVSTDGSPALVNGRYAYEYQWDVSAQASGVYGYAVTARKGAEVLRKNGRLAVVK